nr:probable receptor-like protein kinase At4g39110 [Ipomoea batatas]GMD90497.1 probable receptor-like protein kinase At4g39110 [Ipomoea batatas]
MEKKPRGLSLISHLSSLAPPSSPPPTMATLLVVLLFLIIFAANPNPMLHVHAQQQYISAKAFETFVPPDNYLLNCGASSVATLPGGRMFQPDHNTDKYLSNNGEENKVSVPQGEGDDKDKDIPDIYHSAKVFVSEATYTFHVTSPGLHWIRLHFWAFKAPGNDLKTAMFSVMTETLVLLWDFQMENQTAPTVKEYLVNVTTERFPLTFRPVKTMAFINAIEFVSAPDPLFSNLATLLFPVSEPFELSGNAFETVHRVNVGGPQLGPEKDTLGRRWESDEEYLKPKEMGQTVSVSPGLITYPKGGGSPVIAPPLVYASAVKMADSGVMQAAFNITWQMDIDNEYTHLLRLHFCDIVSKGLNELYFNVYINDKVAISALDLSTITNKLATAYFKDLVINSSMVSSPLKVKVGPMNDAQGIRNAILNGVEVFRLNNSVGSLGGEYGVDGKAADGHTANGNAAAAVGFAMMFGAFVGLGAMAARWQKRPQNWQRRQSFSSWLLPIHAGDSSFMSSKSKSHQFHSSATGLGRYFTLAELQEATKNWDQKEIVGIGAINPQLPREQVNLAEWAMQWKKKGLLDKIIDPTLKGKIDPESMNKFAEAAEKCLAEYGDDRPSMGDVLWSLEHALQLQENSIQGQAEDENIAAATPSASPAAATPENRLPIPSPEQSTAGAQEINEHSGTTMFAHQFSALNGR